MAESAGFGISAGCVVLAAAPGKRLPASYSACQDFPESPDWIDCDARANGHLVYCGASTSLLQPIQTKSSFLIS
jgi:hypothetical protein